VTFGNVILTITALDASGTPSVIFAQGAPITLVARFTNTGTVDELLMETDGCGMLDYTVNDRFGAQAAPLFSSLFGALCTKNLVTHTIAAGQTIELTFEWDQTDNTVISVRRGNYQFDGTLRQNGATSFPFPSPLEIAIGGNTLVVTGTASNNGIVASRVQASVGTVQVDESQNTGQTALTTATVIATAIALDPDYEATVTDLGNDTAQVEVTLAVSVSPTYLPVLFDVTSNDPTQQVTTP
jgi:hypothetical protein